MPPATALPPSAWGSTPTIVPLVGSEGGFSLAETALVASVGVSAVALAPPARPIETAAAALLAAVTQALAACHEPASN